MNECTIFEALISENPRDRQLIAVYADYLFENRGVTFRQALRMSLSIARAVLTAGQMNDACQLLREPSIWRTAVGEEMRHILGLPADVELTVKVLPGSRPPVGECRGWVTVHSPLVSALVSVGARWVIRRFEALQVEAVHFAPAHTMPFLI